MSDSRFLIEVRITHEQPLEADAQTIADLAARGITEALSGDPTLLATATGRDGTVDAIYWEGYAKGLLDGKVIALTVIEETIPEHGREHKHYIDAERAARKVRMTA